ncbi:MAG: cytochrome P460 family protein [Gaiellaceae bacterium]
MYGRPLALVLVYALALVLALAACGGEPEPPPAPEAAPEPETTTTTPAPPTTEAATTEESTTEAAPPPKPKAPPGVPDFVAGYRGWTKLNEAPIPPRDSDPHFGTKDVFASRERLANGRFPAGTVVVKEATRPGADFIGLIATMRKQRGADPEHNDWVFVEYTRESANAAFTEQAAGAVCWSCHVGARDLDYVFTE